MPGTAAELTTVFGIPMLRPAIPVAGTVRLWMRTSGGVTVSRPVMVELFVSRASMTASPGSAMTRTRYCPAPTPGGTRTVELVASVAPVARTTPVRVGPMGMSGPAGVTGTRTKPTLNGAVAEPRFFSV